MKVLFRAAEWFGRNWGRAERSGRRAPLPRRVRPKIGLALGGGFARGISHLGVLRVFEAEGIPVDFIGGVSAGSIVASAYASGASLSEIESAARRMRFEDVASWTLSWRGFADSRRMQKFLEKLLKVHTFEEMKIPLTVVATDLRRAEPVIFRDTGDVFLPVRASCSYPGLFLPMEHAGQQLVDGGISMELPVEPVRAHGADKVIAVHLPVEKGLVNTENLVGVIHRSIQVMQQQLEPRWRSKADLVITPAVGTVGWNDFEKTDLMIEAGERAAFEALPLLREWLDGTVEATPGAAPGVSASTPRFEAP